MYLNAFPVTHFDMGVLSIKLFLIKKHTNNNNKKTKPVLFPVPGWLLALDQYSFSFPPCDLIWDTFTYLPPSKTTDSQGLPDGNSIIVLNQLF